VHQGQQWFLAVANAGIAALLLFAATAKLASPSALGQTLRVLTGVPASGRTSVVRVIGGTEAVVAVCLTIPVLRVLSALAVAVLGVAFIVVGTLARVRHLEEPCGCFGAATDSAPGLVNIVLGLAALADSVLDLVIRPAVTVAYREALPIGAACALLLACVAAWSLTGRRSSRLSPQ